jgi:hypothetical protein
MPFEARETMLTLGYPINNLAFADDPIDPSDF